MWCLSHLANHHQHLDDERAGTLSVDVLTHYASLFFHRRTSSGQVGDARNFVAELFLNITRAMFAEGAVGLDDIWARRSSPLTYWKVDELPGMCLYYTSSQLIPN